MKLFKGLAELHEAKAARSDYIDHRRDRNEDVETPEYDRLCDRVDEARNNVNPLVVVFLG
jgi:hypothetical protein